MCIKSANNNEHKIQNTSTTHRLDNMAINDHCGARPLPSSPPGAIFHCFLGITFDGSGCWWRHNFYHLLYNFLIILLLLERITEVIHHRTYGGGGVLHGVLLLLVVEEYITLLLNEYYELLQSSSWHFRGSKKSAKDEGDLVRSDLAVSCVTYEYGTT